MLVSPCSPVIVSWSLRHNVLFFSHLCLCIPTPVSSHPFTSHVGELELKSLLLLPYVRSAKLHLQVGLEVQIGTGTDLDEPFLAVKGGRETHPQGVRVVL